MELSKIASAVYNDVVSGLSGMNSNPNISMEQLEDEVAEMRTAVIKEFFLKNLLKPSDFAMAINCVDLDCKDPSKCCANPSGKQAMHFEIPRLMEDLGEAAIIYVGSTDRTHPYKVYTRPEAMKFHKYKTRNSSKPYVYIEKTPNENNMYDGWVFNAPFLKRITVIAVFRDLRDLERFNCCNTPEFSEFGSISMEVKDRLTRKKLQYYRQFIQQPHQTDGVPR